MRLYEFTESRANLNEAAPAALVAIPAGWAAMEAMAYAYGFRAAGAAGASAAAYFAADIQLNPEKYNSGTRWMGQKYMEIAGWISGNEGSKITDVPSVMADNLKTAAEDALETQPEEIQSAVSNRSQEIIDQVDKDADEAQAMIAQWSADARAATDAAWDAEITDKAPPVLGNPEGEATSGLTVNPFDDNTDTTTVPPSIVAPELDTKFTAPELDATPTIHTRSPELRTPGLQTDTGPKSTSGEDSIVRRSSSTLDASELDVTPTIDVTSARAEYRQAELKKQIAAANVEAGRAREAQRSRDMAAAAAADGERETGVVNPPAATGVVNPAATTSVDNATATGALVGAGALAGAATAIRGGAGRGRSKKVGGVGMGWKPADNEFKAIQVYDPLKLKRSQQYIPGENK